MKHSNAFMEYLSRKLRLPLGKLLILSSKEVCAILSRYGFMEMRQRGGHIVIQRRLPDRTITVPVPDCAEIRIGTLQSIIRQSELPLSEFEA
jgi:predicted RNA binding protein YcfA (HicA-like mRNA interferase family)